MSTRSERIKAVLDTNVLVSALLSGAGPTGRILDALRGARFDLVLSPALLDELLEVLLRPQLGISVRTAARLVATVRHRALLVGGEYSGLNMVQDPDDNWVLACALEGDADYLVTGDRMLLRLKDHRVGGHRVLRILRPAAFLRVL